MPTIIGSRLELLVDGYLIEQLDGARLRLHHPTPQEVSIVFDKPWDGSTSGYVTVFEDGGRFRMYYRGSDWVEATNAATHELTCYAESTDGITWTQPELGLFEYEGSSANNIVWQGDGTHAFAPCKDTNPHCDPAAPYKAVAPSYADPDVPSLIGFKSPDGLHWSPLQKEPLIRKGEFDSQNLAFWDGARGRYVEFHRGWIGSWSGVRSIMTSTSADFVNWTEPQMLDFGDAPSEHLYTNAVTPYFRAPHILVGFPKRFMPERKRVAEHSMEGVSDGVFMTSRDGIHWRRWLEAFIRPGPQAERWWQRNNMTAWGLLVTKSAIAGAPDELSLYSSENYHAPGNRLRRYTLRMDGFVSAYANSIGGELLTRKLIFEGRELVLNYSTGGAGGLQVEIQDAEGRPIPGFTLSNCPPIYGDAIEEPVRWEGGGDLSALSGVPIRLRFVLKDADLYSMRFRP
jgi:hypothetical protein